MITILHFYNISYENDLGEYFCRIRDRHGNDHFVYWTLKARNKSIQFKHETKQLSKAQMEYDELVFITNLTTILLVVIAIIYLSFLAGYFTWCHRSNVQVVGEVTTVIERVMEPDPEITISSSIDSGTEINVISSIDSGTEINVISSIDPDTKITVGSNTDPGTKITASSSIDSNSKITVSSSPNLYSNRSGTDPNFKIPIQQSKSV